MKILFITSLKIKSKCRDRAIQNKYKIATKVDFNVTHNMFFPNADREV